MRVPQSHPELIEVTASLGRTQPEVSIQGGRGEKTKHLTDVLSSGHIRWPASSTCWKLGTYLHLERSGAFAAVTFPLGRGKDMGAAFRSTQRRHS